MDRDRVLYRYRVERYLPGMTVEELRHDLARLAVAAAGVAAEGATVRYLGSAFAPDEESCFSTFESEDFSVVERVCSRAELVDARITRIEEFSPDGAHSEGVQ